MTVKEKLEFALVQLGMFKQQAQTVMEIAVPKIDELSDEYQIEWDSDWSVYEDAMYIFLFKIIKREALMWTEEHVPKIWFKENLKD